MLVKRASLLLDVVDGRVASIDVPAETIDKYGEQRDIDQMDTTRAKKSEQVCKQNKRNSRETKKRRDGT